MKFLLYFVAISVSTLLISNIAAVKLWNLFGIAVDGGVVLFPLTYILGDLTVEFYGKKIAKSIVLAGFIMNIVAVITYYIVIALPAYEGWNMQEAFVMVLGFTPRIIAGSLVGYVGSNLFNNYVFTKLKQTNTIFGSSFIARALGSSVVARLIDSALFETIAFIGVLPFNEFLSQAIFAYVIGLVIEALLSPFESLIAKAIGKKIEPYAL